MVATNQYYPFANANGANVLSPADYQALTSRETGFVAGIALSEWCNTVWRQSSVASAMLGQFIADIGLFNANDDGSVANLLKSFENTLQGGRLIFGQDVSADPNAMSAVLITPVPALIPGMTVRILKNAATNTGPASLNIGLGFNTVTRAGGAATQSGDIPANSLIEYGWDGTQWQMMNFQGFNAQTVNNNNYTLSIPYTQDTSVTPNTITAPFSPALTSLNSGDMIKIKLANTVTGATIVQVNAIPSIQMVRPDSSAIQQGDAVVGQILILEYDGTNLQLVNIMNTSAFVRGCIYQWPLETVPAGTLECNGQAVSRTTYAGLFALIGTTYGPGNGTTTFNLPDYRGQFMRGWDHGRGLDPNAGTRTNRGDGTVGDHVGTQEASSVKSSDLGGTINITPSSGHTSVLQASPGGVEGTDEYAVLYNTGASGGLLYDPSSNYIPTNASSVFGSVSFPSSTGPETRPVNINIMYVIAY